MGWTSYYLGRGYTKRQACQEVLDDYLRGSHMEAVASALVKSDRGSDYEPIDYVGYVAFRFAEGTKAARCYGDKVMALIILLGYRGGEAWYKEMDETEGPIDADCPLSVLDELSPTESAFAEQWRARCFKNALARRARDRARRRLAKADPGTRVFFVVPADGYPWPRDERVGFTVVRPHPGKTLLRSDDGTLFRTRGMPYECLSV